MKSIAERKAQLLARLEELDVKLHEIEHDLDQPRDKDAEESAVERESDEVLESMGNAGLTEVRAIKAALDRIDAGEYGDCVRCGEKISEERLDTIPYAPLCRNCAAEAH